MASKPQTAETSTEEKAPTHFAEGVPVPQVPTSPATVNPDGVPTEEDYAKEWGQFRAAGPIHLGHTLILNTGDPIPASHPYLEQWLAEEQAVRVEQPA